MKRVLIKHEAKKILKISSKGFTLVEVIISAAVLLLTFVGILTSYIRCLELTELSRNTSIAVNAARSRMEDIKNTQFGQIASDYHNVTFTASGLTGIGVTYVDSSNPDLLRVTAVFCWRQSNGRVIGEDINLNGQVNSGEDQNGNGLLDSSVRLVSNIYEI
ncbi:MAG: prepilin-type N-terminal cleavage/methylation domain-containing protein [Candidatus Omnitrophota bacterium]